MSKIVQSAPDYIVNIQNNNNANELPNNNLLVSYFDEQFTYRAYLGPDL